MKYAERDRHPPGAGDTIFSSMEPEALWSRTMSNRVRLTLSPGLSLGTVSAAIALLTIPANALDVTVNGLRNARGDVVVCVWRKQDKGFPNCGAGRPFKKLVTAATQPKVSFLDLPDGAYAVSMFHDEKRSGKLETNLVGLPTSGVGLANNPSISPMSPPTFDKALVVVPAAKAIEITAKYLF